MALKNDFLEVRLAIVCTPTFNKMGGGNENWKEIFFNLVKLFAK
jgi:hypothetical protein